MTFRINLPSGATVIINQFKNISFTPIKSLMPIYS